MGDESTFAITAVEVPDVTDGAPPRPAVTLGAFSLVWRGRRDRNDAATERRRSQAPQVTWYVEDDFDASGWVPEALLPKLYFRDANGSLWTGTRAESSGPISAADDKPGVHLSSSFVTTAGRPPADPPPARRTA